MVAAGVLVNVARQGGASVIPDGAPVRATDRTRAGR
jgi:hypothetical protein